MGIRSVLVIIDTNKHVPRILYPKLVPITYLQDSPQAGEWMPIIPSLRDLRTTLCGKSLGECISQLKSRRDVGCSYKATI